MDENRDNAKILRQMQEDILQYCDNIDYYKDHPKEIETIFERILGDILELNIIIDNHEARLRLIERCLNYTKDVYSTYNLNN